MKKIISIVGARPQFIKHAPMQIELMKDFQALTIHTGQHFDENMSHVFFEELNIPKPDYLLELKNKSLQGAQTAEMLNNIEEILIKEKPDFVLVYGDTNSTLAGVLAASKLLIPIIHIEAGLRSFNKSMPEEINRIIADHTSSLLFCPNENAKSNLINENISENNIYIVGDVMCDILNLLKTKVSPKVDYQYYFATIHRPYNTDNKERIISLLSTFQKLDKKVVFCIHPRTKKILNTYGISLYTYNNIVFIDPVGYVDSLSFQNFANAIITDSGGMQKEAYMLKKKCITIRSETEWTETLIGGWNHLVYDNIESICSILEIEPKGYQEAIYGTGNASKLIVDKILKYG